jgi:hypothetical protein
MSSDIWQSQSFLIKIKLRDLRKLARSRDAPAITSATASLVTLDHMHPGRVL